MAKPAASESAPQYCVECGERLPACAKAWLCPGCGAFYDPREPASVLLRPPLARWKFWLPGYLLAVTCGSLMYALCLQGGGSRQIGWGLFLALPVCFGSLLGYGTRKRAWVWTFVALTAGGGGYGLLASLAYDGAPWGAVVGAIAGALYATTILFGVMFGAVLRLILINCRWDQHQQFPHWVWLLAAWALGAGPLP